MEPTLQVDIRTLFRQKQPKVARFLPRFVMNWLERLLHQEQINQSLRDYGHLSGLPFVRAILEEHLHVRYVIHGSENIPKEGRYIFVCNHPLGGLDGLILLDAIGKNFPNVRFVVNDILMNLTPLRPLFLPINKYGRQPLGYVEDFRHVFQSDTQVLFFPAGICSRKLNGKVTDLPWRVSFLKNAIESKRDIVPIYFHAQNTNKFYNIANFRRFIKLPLNIEILWLADELYKKQNTTLPLIVGKPIPIDSLVPYSLKSGVEIVRNSVYELNTLMYNK